MRTLSIFGFLSIFFVLVPTTVFSLTCYECQERKAGAGESGDWCSKPRKQECNGQTSICLKYVHKEGKPGFPNHILAKCELRSFYTQNKINACEKSVRRRSGGLTISETCTCDTDLCNDATLSVSKMIDQGATPEQVTQSPPPSNEGKDDDHEDNDEERETEAEAVENPHPEVKDSDEESEAKGLMQENQVTDGSNSKFDTTDESESGSESGKLIRNFYFQLFIGIFTSFWLKNRFDAPLP